MTEVTVRADDSAVALVIPRELVTHDLMIGESLVTRDNRIAAVISALPFRRFGRLVRTASASKTSGGNDRRLSARAPTGVGSDGYQADAFPTRLPRALPRERERARQTCERERS